MVEACYYWITYTYTRAHTYTFTFVSPCQSHTQSPCIIFKQCLLVTPLVSGVCQSFFVYAHLFVFVWCECENSKWRGSVRRLKMTAVLKNADNSTPVLLNSLLFPQNGLLCHCVTRAKMESTSEQLHSHAFTQNRQLCDWASGAKMESTFQSSHPMQMHNKPRMNSQQSHQLYLSPIAWGLKLLIIGWKGKSKQKVG